MSRFLGALEAPPLGLYVHLPWCVRKCPYCDFNSHRAPATLPESAYVEALLRDLDQDLPLVAGRALGSIFFGGGTPSLFSADAIAGLLQGFAARCEFIDGIEITLEANPGTAEQQRFQAYRQAGVNRLSLGIQSLDDGMLRSLGRIHGRAEALAAVATARGAGFDNLNLDMMVGLPGQSLAAALQDIDELIALSPEHISYYQLTLEPDTVFARHPPALPTDDGVWIMQLAARRRLIRAGYRRYEVSAYARGGKRSRHNLNYWTFGDYLGIGAGAHGKLSDPRRGEILRRWKPKQPRIYLSHAGTPEGIAGERHLAPGDRLFEFMLNALRLTDGVSTGLFSKRTGLPWETLHHAREEAVGMGLLHPDPERLLPTARGRRFLNDLVGLFLPDDQATVG